MDKKVAIAVSLIVVLGVFFISSYQSSAGSNFSEKVSHLNPQFSLPTLFLPSFSVSGLNETAVALEAWSTFKDYLEATHTHNLPKVTELSYQLSPTCADPSKTEECYGLMDGFYYFAKDFKEKDFSNVVYDNKQIVLSTDYIPVEDTGVPLKTTMIFVRDESGKAKILKLRFCFESEDGTRGRCVETDPEKRDLDNNGWWDDVEALFY